MPGAAWGVGRPRRHPVPASGGRSPGRPVDYAAFHTGPGRRPFLIRSEWARCVGGAASGGGVSASGHEMLVEELDDLVDMVREEKVAPRVHLHVERAGGVLSPRL